MVFWNTGILKFLSMKSPTKFYHVIQTILQMCSCDQGLVTLAFLWEKLSQLQLHKDLNRKSAFLEERSWFKFNNLGLALGTNFYTSVKKRVKTKSQKVFWAISTFVTGEKLVEGVFLSLSPILNRV